MFTFGERLKKERERLGLTQTEFGKKAGIEKETQSNYERDKRFPKLEYFERINSMGVNVQYVILGKISSNDENHSYDNMLVNTIENELQRIKKGFEGIESLIQSLKK